VTELAGQSDYISLHVPDVPGTHKLLSRAVLEAVKPGCRIVNTSSYPAVDEDALLEGLRSGRVAGAAFDVFNTHPVAPNSPLLHLDNVVLTPHIGGATLETVARHSQMVVEDISTFVQGRMPNHLVNPEVWDRRD
jgi:phosphoglycerate dehydrogenase-like enzyme